MLLVRCLLRPTIDSSINCGSINLTAILRCKPSFAKFSRSFREVFVVFGRFEKFSDVFGPVRMRSDAFGHIRMQLDAFRCVGWRLDISGNFRIFTKFSDDFDNCWSFF